jgi:hypothetical protein
MNGKAVDARQDDDMHGRVTSEVGVAERRLSDFRRGRQESLCFRATRYSCFHHACLHSFSLVPSWDFCVSHCGIGFASSSVHVWSAVFAEFVSLR